ncbi:TetR/AcrR family transcriptional regulator [Methylobacterium sp. WL64]|uniref:TetR/AcrR family transcriptional regulator n=1 Tax=Methylobacterium sp. WL64 TaxID=2603894 RepID=UPI0011C91788|nr:TetR/AcrR family transcriptional regulator [Methylobacterium sp. WL64]TXM98855.1 TetR/AcrR family transcriptional regulator [Methylobacterium sp. WL64]
MTGASRREAAEAPAATPSKRPRASLPGKTAETTRNRLMRAARAEFTQHGFAGARVERILAKARVNPRMLYHHFPGKSGLYVAVLENALGELRQQELSLDIEQADPLEGLLQLFDFLNDHFEANQDLVRLLSGENLLKARFMRRSAVIREMSSPTLAMIDQLLARGGESGDLAPGHDPLRLYVLMVALTQFHLSNLHTLSAIFEQDLAEPRWRAARRADARMMLQRFLMKKE